MTTPQVITRSEQPTDHAAIARVNRLAFDRDAEADLVARIRASEEFDPSLSLVALLSGEVVGHILLSPIDIETACGDAPALALAPMAVLPERQRQGIGSQLVQAGLNTARRAGHCIAIVVGHPNYYPRFGFVPASRFDLRARFAVPNEAFMAMELQPGSINPAGGRVRYPTTFDGV